MSVLTYELTSEMTSALTSELSSALSYGGKAAGALHTPCEAGFTTLNWRSG